MGPRLCVFDHTVEAVWMCPRLPLFKYQPYRCACEAEGVAERIFEVALIMFGDKFGLIGE